MEVQIKCFNFCHRRILILTEVNNKIFAANQCYQDLYNSNLILSQCGSKPLNITGKHMKNMSQVIYIIYF